MKKRIAILLFIAIFLLFGCGRENVHYDIAATTLPVYDFTVALCENTGLSVGRLVTENVSCLHDYTLQVTQMRMIESADTVVISGAGLEEFMDDVLSACDHVIDASENAHIHEGEHHHEDEHSEEHHHHDQDPHIWLSPENAKHMAQSICQGLIRIYPQHESTILTNYQDLYGQLDELQRYGEETLNMLSCRELITFHDGFAYFAESFDLEILEAIEEESGSEASAAEIIHLIDLINQHQLPAVFTEVSGSDACAGIVQAETDVQVFSLDMAMAGNSYFDSMYHNIDTIKEALG